MTDEKSTSPTNNESTSADGTDEKSPRKDNEGKSRTFRIPTHCESILQSLNKQRSSGEFCDITVLVEHQRFSAHKCVLAANSAYFRSLLATDNDGIFLRHITAESFAAILDFMYTSRLHLEASLVQDILSAAKFLQIKGVVSICCRYLESQLRVLTRDLDETKSNKGNRQAMLPMNADLYKKGAFPSISPLHQQPPLSYNCNIGALESELQRNNQFKPVVLSSDQHQPNFMLPYQSTRPQGVAYQPPMQFNNPTQNYYPSPVSQSFTLRNRNMNPTHHPQEMPNLNSSTVFRDSIAPSMMPKQAYLPHASYPVVTHGMNPLHNQGMLNQNTNYIKPAFVIDPKTNPYLNPTNPFSYAPTFNPMAAQGNPNIQGGNRYTSLSTAGGKGRRQYIPARRKGSQGPVSAGSSFKFTFGEAKPFPSTSTPLENKSATKEEPPSGRIVLFSRARDGKSSAKDKKPLSPETVFHVEAEDRYWDALSSKAQTYNNSS